jgi:CBS domain-containing protein
MNAGDVMTRKIIAVRPDAPASAIALTLLENGISAVPVVDENGAPIGMVSEGDLMPRDESERLARRDWWLKMLAEGEALSESYVAYLDERKRTAREIMSSPVISVDEGASLVEVAELLSANRIKRVPVLRDGRMVGIISRANLVKAVAQGEAGPKAEPSVQRGADMPLPSERLEALTRGAEPPICAAPPRQSDEISADAFRRLASGFEQEEAARRAEMHRDIVEKHRKETRKLLAARLTEESWEHMLAEARHAAERGEREALILRFPCDLCSDHGRAVNAPDPSWPATLRGVAAEAFMRWKNELRPRGFGLHARVIDFPEGVPGDIGLFLSWGK